MAEPSNCSCIVTIDLLPALEPSISFCCYFCSVRHIAIYLSLLFQNDNNKQYQNEVHSCCIRTFFGNCLSIHCSCIRPNQECRPKPRCTTNGVSFHCHFYLKVNRQQLFLWVHVWRRNNGKHYRGFIFQQQWRKESSLYWYLWGIACIRNQFIASLSCFEISA